MQKIDLHIHTKNSDGAFETHEILKMCEEKELKIISITDHDSVQSYFDILDQNISFDGKIVAGIELSFGMNGSVCDVLGYGVDIDIVSSWLKKRNSVEERIKSQEMILEEMKSLYSKLKIKFDETCQISIGKKSEAYNLIKPSAVLYNENKLVAPELFEEMFYRNHHTNPKSKYFVNETRCLPTLKECLDIIHKAGGISSLAHPGAYGYSNQELKNYINFAIESGVMGVELKYNCHTAEQEKIIKQLAEENNLYLTGGSDFHGGKVKQQVKLGVVYGDEFVDGKILDKFLQDVKYFKQ
jgi:predicted metal-dependent phosphoesterase TrpH